ncbi:MAG: hypothetical protein KDB93_01175 [Flavobacteriales bacterium]|nr:hypothetical protein [Flavobacteriales bacterium]
MGLGFPAHHVLVPAFQLSHLVIRQIILAMEMQLDQKGPYGFEHTGVPLVLDHPDDLGPQLNGGHGGVVGWVKLGMTGAFRKGGPWQHLGHLQGQWHGTSPERSIFGTQPPAMGAVSLRTELSDLIRKEKNDSLLEVLKSILSGGSGNTLLRAKLTSRALKAEEDLATGRILGTDEVRARLAERRKR